MRTEQHIHCIRNVGWPGNSFETKETCWSPAITHTFKISAAYLFHLLIIITCLFVALYLTSLSPERPWISYHQIFKYCIETPGVLTIYWKKRKFWYVSFRLESSEKLGLAIEVISLLFPLFLVFPLTRVPLDQVFWTFPNKTTHTFFFSNWNFQFFQVNGKHPWCRSGPSHITVTNKYLYIFIKLFAGLWERRVTTLGGVRILDFRKATTDKQS